MRVDLERIDFVGVDLVRVDLVRPNRTNHIEEYSLNLVKLQVAALAPLALILVLEARCTHLGHCTLH